MDAQRIHHRPQPHYAVPQPMPWPIMGSTALFLHGARRGVRDQRPAGGWVSIAAGLMLLVYMMVRWFGEVIRESEGGKYGGWEDLSFRWGMSWFIFSEVMFFAAFFGALFWMRAACRCPTSATIESQRAGLAGLHRALALGRPGVRRGVHADGGVGHPGDQHRAAAHLRRDRHDRALGAEGEQPRASSSSGSGLTILLGVAVPRSARPTSTATPTRS